MLSWFRKFGNALLQLVYPAVCPVCGEALASGERVVCVRCRWDMPLTDYWMAMDNPALQMLRRELPDIRHASALFFFRHESRYRDMIHSLKYSGRRDIAQAMGELFGRELRDSPLYDDVTMLIPVPLHWSKRIGRGYNQAEEICLGMSRSMGIPADFKSLKRIRRTRTQALHRDPAKRQLNVEGAFRLVCSERLEGGHILLVDDVLTTGATIGACVRAILERLPNARISVATLAVVHHTDKHKTNH